MPLITDSDMILAVLCLAAMIIVLYAFLIEPLLFEITNISIDIPDIPDALDGFIICHITDLHADGYGLLEERIRKRLANVDADMLVMTGDMAHSHDALGAITSVLDGWVPRYGSYAVLGNGEHRCGMDIDFISQYMSRNRIKLLNNSNVPVRVGDSRINVIGVDDPFLQFHDMHNAYEGADEADLELLLAHSPDIIADIDEYRPQLILVGHTHGGQIRLPLIGAIWDHCRYAYRLSAGYFDENSLSARVSKCLGGVRMYVNRGLGGRIIHARFLCRPEIAIIRINKLKKVDENC